jgi:uridylate kinase
MDKPVYRRILLKLSGEILAGQDGFGINPERADYLAKEVKSIYDLGLSIGLIIGAGNIFRGIQAESRGMGRVTGDYLGMMATIMNSSSFRNQRDSNC